MERSRNRECPSFPLILITEITQDERNAVVFEILTGGLKPTWIFPQSCVKTLLGTRIRLENCEKPPCHKFRV